MATATSKPTAYDRITDRIIELIDAGTCPWRPGHNVKPARPGKNYNGRPYRGANAMMTWAVASQMGYESPIWLTFNQARELGGCVRKGEKGTPIIFWGQVAKDDSGDDDKRGGFMFAKHYVVFNLAQVDGVDAGDVASGETTTYSHDPIEAAESIVAGYDGPTIVTELRTPCYRPATDTVAMPPVDRFEAREHYYDTLFHELAHSTGHPSRLNRELCGDRTAYGFEELVAEMTSAFLCDAAGITRATIDNAAAYLAGWSKVIKADRKMFITAASKAQKAADLILQTELATA